MHVSMKTGPSYLTLLGFIRRLVDDRTVLKTAKIKHTDAPIGPTADEYVHAVRAKADVENLLVMSNELSFGC